MRDPSIENLIKQIRNKEPYETLISTVDRELMPYINSLCRNKDIDDLNNDIYKCKKCGLCPVPGHRAMPEGNSYAEIMLVGEAAGEVECEQNHPFVGPAGQLLTKMLESAAKNIDSRFDRKRLYLTNVVKGRPLDGTKNRQPTQEERIACNNFLTEEIRLIKPSVIICVGAVAAEMLISPTFKISDQQGCFFGDEPKKIAMFHPSYLLHLDNGSKEQNEAKKQCWNVLLTVNEYLEKISGVPRI